MIQHCRLLCTDLILEKYGFDGFLSWNCSSWIPSVTIPQQLGNFIYLPFQMILIGTDWYRWWIKPGITGKLLFFCLSYICIPKTIHGIDKATSTSLGFQSPSYRLGSLTWVWSLTIQRFDPRLYSIQRKKKKTLSTFHDTGCLRGISYK